MRRPAPLWLVLVVMLSAAGMSLAAFGTAEAQRHRSDRALCVIIRIQDDAYQQAPPQTTTGKKIARAFKELRRLRCPGSD